MKPESVSPARPQEAGQTARGPSKANSAKDTPPDLFATLLSSAEEAASTTPLAEDAAAGPVTDPAPTLVAPDTPKDVKPQKAAVDREPAADGVAAMVLAGLPMTPPGETASTSRADKAGGQAPVDTGGPGQWVSTVARSKTRTPPPQALVQMMEAAQVGTGQGLTAAEPVQMTAWHMNAAGQVAGQLRETLGEPESLDLSVFTTTVADQASTGQDAGTGARGESPRVILESAGTARGQSDAAAGPRFDTLLGEALGPGADGAFQELGQQVSLWAAGNTRKASLLLEAGLKEALEVDVSLQGDKAQLTFRTDDATAREALRAHAYEVLNDMLSRAGIGLDSLSIGGRSARDQESSDRPSTDRLRSGADQPADEPVNPARHLGTWKGSGLSVYA